MALVVADRVMETTNAAGTAAIALQGAIPGYRTFASAFITGSQVPYVITRGVAYEVGVGTVTTGTPWTLTRDTITASSNAGAAIDVAAGMSVFVDATAAYLGELQAQVGDVGAALDILNGAVI